MRSVVQAQVVLLRPLKKGPAGSPLWWSGQEPWMGQYRVMALPRVGAGGAAEALGLGWGPRWCHGVSPQVVVTGMLQLCLLAITDKGNNPTLLGTQAIVTGILIVIIGVSLGMNSGYAINPSRDLPPRFFTFLAGWGSQVFRYCMVQLTPGSFLRVPCMWRVEQPRKNPGDPPPPLPCHPSQWPGRQEWVLTFLQTLLLD